MGGICTTTSTRCGSINIAKLTLRSTPLSKRFNNVFFAQRAYASDLPSHTTLGLPALSPTMTQGNIAKWTKKEGDALSPGDIVAVIETDKASMDWELTEGGYLAKILIPAGSKDIPVGKPAIIVVEDQADVAKFKDYVAEEAGAAKPTKAAPTQPQKAAPPPASRPDAPTSQTSQTQPPFPAQGRVVASPLARKVAQEQGVSLASISGTGPNARIIKADVLEFAATQATAATPVRGDTYTDYPNSNVRKVIAARLTESKQTIPHYYLTTECQVDKLLKLRADFNAKAEGKYKLSVNDFIIKAAAVALKRKPAANSAWMGEFIRRYHNVDINVAVNTDDGLFTPIVFDADKKGLISISETVKELARKAKERKLQPSEFQGGTFTISNLGMFGIKQFAAVINPPQACILAVGGTEKKVVVSDAKSANPAEPFSVVSVLNVTLSCDHRVVDGAVGAEWLQVFKELVEDPVKMLL